MHHHFYRGSALKAELDTRRRLRVVLDDEVSVRWEQTQIDLRHQLKASSPAIWCIRVLTRFGVSPQVALGLAPVLLHVEALVYRGDFDYEAAQLEGTSDQVDSQWSDGIEEILRAYEINSSPILSALRDLKTYFQLESAVMEGREPLSPDLIEQTCYIRCSGGTLLLRIACALAGVQYEERLFTLIGHMSAHDEISTDLPSYAEDIAEGQFNVFRLATWVYGSDGAERHLRVRGDGILAALLHDIQFTDRETLTLFAGVIPPILPWDPQLPSPTARMLPRALLARLISARIRFHEKSNPLQFPAPLNDNAPTVLESSSASQQ